MSVFPAKMLSAVCDISMGQAPKGDSYNAMRSGYPLIAGAGDFGELTPAPKKYTDAPTKLSRPGDLILCIRATIGDRNWSDKEYCLGRGVAGLRAKDADLSQAYLWHWLDHVAPVLRTQGRGATFLQVSKGDIAALQIPLPPLDEQKRIAGILDAADALRAKRREALAQLDTLLQSTFLDMFGDPVTNPKGWDTSTLGEVGEVITGNTPSRKRPEYYGEDIEWIKSDNINDPSFVLTEAEERLSVAGKAVARTCPRGSILVTCIAGSPSCIGNAAIADREVAFNQQINAFVPGERIALWFAFGMFWMGKRLVQSASTSSMKGMVSKSAFSAISIPIPPTSLQSRFAAVVESIEEQKSRQRAHLAELDTLFASLQSRAFRGDL